MSIENQLKLAFKQSAGQVNQPSALDDRIEQLFDKHSRGQSKRFNWFTKHNKMARVAIIAACFLVFSGFAYASTVLYHLNSNSISIKVATDSQFNFTQQQMDKIINARLEVKSQLAPSEAAIVFIAELDKIKFPGITDDQGMGLISISNPQSYPNMEEWKELTKQTYAAFKVPTELPDGFTFVRGEIEQTNFGTDQYDREKYYELLKNKAIAANLEMAWKKADSADYAHHTTDLNRPKLIYSNSADDQIEITYTVKPPGVDNMNFTMLMGDASTVEKVKVAGKKAYYTINPAYFLSDTGFMQDINWLEDVDGQTIIYYVSSSSEAVTLEDLLLVANHLE